MAKPELLKPDQPVAIDHDLTGRAVVGDQSLAQRSRLWRIRLPVFDQRPIGAQVVRLLKSRNGIDVHDGGENVGAFDASGLEGGDFDPRRLAVDVKNPDRRFIDR